MKSFIAEVELHGCFTGSCVLTDNDDVEKLRLKSIDRSTKKSAGFINDINDMGSR